jgi:PAS domain S-box-containing protein
MLHILYVDDEEGFRELTELYLERADDVQVDTADSAETALAMMRHEAYDAVVSDFQMPGMDGVDLLRTIRASGATVPFVLFTGKGREDVVIEAFESGVDFYLQKGGDPVSQYAELLHKVRQAVAFHDAQQAQQRSDQFYRRLYNETPLGILHYDGDGTIVDCNDEFVAIIGSSREVLIGLNMLGELQDDELKRQVRHSLETGRGHYTGLYRSVTADKATHVRIIFKGMRDAKGAIYGGIGLVEDISAQISAEDRLAALAKEYETVFMGTQDAMFLVAVEGGAFRYIRNNRSHQELTGLSPEELQGKTPQDLVGPVMGDAISANYRRCIKERKSITYEETLDLRTGTKVWRTTLTPVFECERPAYIVGSSQDITKYRQALEAVAESRESYRRLVENLNEVIYTLDTRAKITYISPNIASIGGYEPSAILGRNFVDFVHPADKEARMEQFSKIIAGDLRPTEYRLLTKGGNPLWVRTSARPIVKGGDVVGVQGVLVDIDKRKRAELAVRDSELKYRTLFEDSRDAIWVTSADGRVIDANPAAFELMGYPRGEFVGIEARLLYANPADRDVFVRRIHRFGYVKDFEVRLKRKDGSSVLCTFTSHLWQDDEGGVIGYRGIVRDISEQKRLENTLRREARLQELLIDISSSFIGIPPERLDAAIGVSIAQLGEAFGADRAYIHAYDFEKKTASNTHEWCAPGIDACISSLQDVPFSVVGRGWVDSHRRGETIIIDDVSNLPNRNTERRKLKPQGIKSIITVPLMDGGECIGFVGFESVHDRYDFSGLGERILKIYANMLINVYNRRKMERELVAGERRLRTYIESAPEGIFVIDRDGYYRDVNERACCMTGYTRDELLSMSIRDIASPEASPGTMETYHTLLTKGEVQAELLLRRKDGSDFPASLKAIELSDSRYMGFCSDITEHKLAEQALRDSEERYRLITENMGDNVTMFDFSLSVVYTSPSIEKMRGYTVEEVMRQSSRQRVP